MSDDIKSMDNVIVLFHINATKFFVYFKMLIRMEAVVRGYGFQTMAILLYFKELSNVNLGNETTSS